MNPLETAQALGLTLPGPAYIAGALLFGVLGLAAWRWGRHIERPAVRWLGLALMLYPYVVTETWSLFGVGMALCVGVWFASR